MKNKSSRLDLYQGIHNQTINNIAENLLKHGYVVNADHIGWKNGVPPSFHGFRPDIYAAYNSSRLIIEVETVDSLSKEHTIDQLLAFDKASEEIGATCYIVVPFVKLREEEIIKKSETLKKDYKLQNSIISYYKYENLLEYKQAESDRHKILHPLSYP